MLKIVYTTERNPNARTVVKDWSMNEPIPMFSRSFLWGVLSVEASDAEKIHVDNFFDNLPTTNASRVTWVGEYAKFIVSNFCELE